MKIVIANDHGGLNLKKYLYDHLKEDYDILNIGAETQEGVDYPDYAIMVGKLVSNKEVDLGILICRTGIGMSIACNKIQGALCAKVSNQKEAKLSKLHNNANVITLSGTMNEEKALKIVKVFIETPFSKHPRHIRRVKKIYG
jgi:ribose 5-phosphate isomerase B